MQDVERLRCLQRPPFQLPFVRPAVNPVWKQQPFGRKALTVAQAEPVRRNVSKKSADTILHLSIWIECHALSPQS